MMIGLIRDLYKAWINHISIALNALITSGTDRIIDLNNIYRLLMFMAHPQSKSNLYIKIMYVLRK